MSNDRIVKKVELRAPVSRVWRALTDHTEFSQWFQTKVHTPFTPGQVSKGNVTSPGYEHMLFEAHVEKLEPERFFSFRWHPGDDTGLDLSKEPMTLVEFTLEKTATGTLLTVVESGFEQLPPGRRERAFTGNEGGWAGQLVNIGNHVHAAA